MYTPPTPTRRDKTVSSRRRRRCVLGFTLTDQRLKSFAGLMLSFKTGFCKELLHISILFERSALLVNYSDVCRILTTACINYFPQAGPLYSNLGPGDIITPSNVSMFRTKIPLTFVVCSHCWNCLLQYVQSLILLLVLACVVFIYLI